MQHSGFASYAALVGVSSDIWIMNYLGLPLEGNSMFREPVLRKFLKDWMVGRKYTCPLGEDYSYSILSIKHTPVLSLFTQDIVTIAHKIEKLMRDLVWGRRGKEGSSC